MLAKKGACFDMQAVAGGGAGGDMQHGKQTGFNNSPGAKFQKRPRNGFGATPTTYLVCHFRLLGGGSGGRAVCLWNISSPSVDLWYH